MSFNEFGFICLLLPLSVLAYYLLPCRKLVLIVASVIFYCYGDWKVGIVLAVSMAVNFGFSRVHARWAVALPVVINVAVLLTYKYTSWVMPVGISFFTFQQIAYVVTVYRGELESTALVDYLVYILYFPKLLMGPLAEPADFIGQLNDESRRRVNWDNIACGVKIFSLGLFKKVMIADVFAGAVTWAYGNVESTIPADWLLVMLFYTFEIYFDFSGYSDMAVGASIMFNIELPINFDSPYKALNIRDFWKRWHVSLTSFFTKYIYIPLGGSRRGNARTYLNTMIVFLISGIWHGNSWTFVVWGLLHGVFMVFDRIFDKVEAKVLKPVRWALTFIVVNVLWLLFRCDSIGQWWTVLKAMAGVRSLQFSQGLIDCFWLPESQFIQDLLHVEVPWMAVYIVAALGICLIPENNYRSLKKLPAWAMVLAAVAFVWGFICLSSESVFVYFGF